ncbi:MAG: RHS repeat-associated core domain-containing protein [Verrucomicrobiales bacterium]
MTWQVKRIPDTVLTDILVSYKTGYDYGSLDRVERLHYPDGDQLDYQFNARNLLEAIPGGPTGHIISNIDYQPSGQPAHTAYGNSNTTDYEYDPRLRLDDLKTYSPAEGRHLIDFRYTFDKANNITRIDDARDLTGLPDAIERQNTQVFTYDSLYRINSVVYPGILGGGTTDGDINYRYDRIGNMLKKQSNIVHQERGVSVTDLGTMSYGGPDGPSGRTGRANSEAGPHALTRVTADGGRNYPYDPNGNMTDIDGLRCEWDFKDRLIAVENDEMRAEYLYDYTDRRVRKVITPNPKPEESLQPPTRVSYINKYFELRNGEIPFKYVWDADTRISRATTPLTTSSTSIQHIRLLPGWNLCNLKLLGVASQLNPANQPSVNAVFWWDPTSSAWRLLPGENLPNHTVLWIRANSYSILKLTGSYLPPSDIDLEEQHSYFVPNTSYSSFDLEALPHGSEVWHWDSVSQSWIYYSQGAPAVLRLPSLEALNSSMALYIKTNNESARIEQSEPLATQIRYFHQDHLGSTNSQSDSIGRRSLESAIYPFGFERLSRKAQSRYEPYTFTQKEFDRSTALHYFEARYLMSALGRFTNPDPLSYDVHTLENASIIDTLPLTNPQARNCYSYALGSPVKFIDPAGKFSLSKAWDYMKMGATANRESTGKPAGALGGAVGFAAGFFESEESMEIIDNAYTETISEEQVILEEAAKLDKGFEKMKQESNPNIGVSALQGFIDRCIKKITEGKYDSVSDIFDDWNYDEEGTEGSGGSE